jgi:hypothetical protein
MREIDPGGTMAMMVVGLLRLNIEKKVLRTTYVKRGLGQKQH